MTEVRHETGSVVFWMSPGVEGVEKYLPSCIEICGEEQIDCLDLCLASKAKITVETTERICFDFSSVEGEATEICIIYDPRTIEELGAPKYTLSGVDSVTGEPFEMEFIPVPKGTGA